MANIERLDIERYSDGSVNVWLPDRPLALWVSPVDAAAAIRKEFGFIDQKILDYLGVASERQKF